MNGSPSAHHLDLARNHPLAMVGMRWGDALRPRPAVVAPGELDHTWVRVDELAAGDGTPHIGRWLRDIQREPSYWHGHAAAIRLADVLTRALLGFTAQTVYVARCAVDISADNLWVHLCDGHATGVPEVALSRPTTAVVADTAQNGVIAHPDVVPLRDTAELDDWVARRVAEMLDPLMRAIRQHTRMGLRTLWGRVADTVHAEILRAARESGLDTDAAWERAGRLADAIAARVPRMRSRPRAFPVQGTDRHGGDWEGTWLVFGTCCFIYKSRADSRYCNVCPFRDDRQRGFDWLRESPPAPKTDKVDTAS